ncbi:kinase-like domain-containing protein [Blastocladiella britannica]|nr:kinase-like domain-containing protein [Blastocladiella britannica]
MDILRHILFFVYTATDGGHDHHVQLAGRKLLYQHKIAEGGFGNVYLARDLSSDGEQYWALKRMSVADDDSRNIFQREVQAHRGAGVHPNVMSIVASEFISSSSAGMQGFILMPFMKDFIDERMARQQPLTPALIVPLFKSACAGILAFHKQDPPLVVRDIKPANMLVSNDAVSLVLTDFGSVCPAVRSVTTRAQADALQDELATSVTAPYRSPECFSVPSHFTLDERTDVWSLGCVLYAMMFGKPAFDGTESAARGRVDYGDRSSEPLTRLIQDMLQVDMTKRPSVESAMQRLSEIPVG